MADSDTLYAEHVLGTVSQPIMVLTGDLTVERVNRAFCETFKVSRGETEDVPISDLGNGQWNIPELRELLAKVRADRGDLRKYRVRHGFPAIGERVMLLNARRMADRGDGRGARIVLAFEDITELEWQRFELEGRKEFAEKLVDSIREGLLILNWDLTVHSANKPYYEMFGFGREDIEGRHIYDLGNGEWNIPALRHELELVLPESSEFDDFEVEIDAAGARRTMLLNGRRLDHLNLIILAIRDVTERRETERRQHAFMCELEHRVNNILSNVRAVAHLTRRNSDDLDTFFSAFAARLAGLSRAQELLLKTPDEDIALAELVRVEMDALGAEEGRCYTMRGPEVKLTPRITQAMAMAMHELATNAGKYGALRDSNGHIVIDWTTTPDAEPDLRLVWREHGVRIDKSASRKGFGSEVIEAMVPHMLGGSSRLTLHEDGAECVFTFPLTQGTPDGEVS